MRIPCLLRIQKEAIPEWIKVPDMRRPQIRAKPGGDDSGAASILIGFRQNSERRRKPWVEGYSILHFNHVVFLVRGLPTNISFYGGHHQAESRRNGGSVSTIGQDDISSCRTSWLSSVRETLFPENLHPTWTTQHSGTER